jgi:Alpha-2-macroglobulin bait region domain
LRATVGEWVDTIHVHISSKGILLESRDIHFGDCESSEENGPTSVEFEINPTASYLPQIFVVAYYIKNGNFIVANAYISLRTNLPNFVKFSFEKMQVKPGAKIDFTVKSYYKSKVSLNAIDQRFVKIDILFLIQTFNQKDMIFQSSAPEGWPRCVGR